MKVAGRIGVPVLFVLVIPSLAAAAHGGSHTSALVWNDTAMVEGGTYSVSLNAPARSYVTGPERIPDGDYAGEFVFELLGKLYKVNAPSDRELVESFVEGPAFDDPDDPNDGDELFAWQSAGTYELELYTFPPPQPFFINALREWLAALIFADVAHAQFGEPIFLATIHFTIEDADAAPAEPDPVIIIPGILGSEQHNGEWIIDPILHTYDDLIATLDANGYTRELDLFPFPYNWRKSNVETAVLLKEKIDEVKAICGCDKVDLVAHSMGGLVARQYIQSDAYDGDVDQLIFLGTPHLGAPKAYLMWEAGEFGPFFPLSNNLLETIFDHEAHEKGYESIFAYMQGEPISSVRELLPIHDYIFEAAHLRDYPTNYPTNPFLENLAAKADDLLNSAIEIHNVIGDISPDQTITAVRVTDSMQYAPMWQHGYPENYDSVFGDHGLEKGDGDGTVPLASASFINSNILHTDYEHSFLPTGTEGNVYHILTGKAAEVLAGDFDSLIEKLMHIGIRSPADILVVAPDGKKIGKDTNGQEINEIPYAFYTGFNTDTEFITILNPLDGEYKIYTQGTGVGQYTVEASVISNSTTTDSSFTGNTAPGITSQLNLDVENGEITSESLNIVITFESTLADLERIYQLKWMNVGIYKSLKAQLLKAKNARQVIAKILLQDMLKQLNVYRGKLINEQGYQILKADFESLIK